MVDLGDDFLDGRILDHEPLQPGLELHALRKIRRPLPSRLRIGKIGHRDRPGRLDGCARLGEKSVSEPGQRISLGPARLKDVAESDGLLGGDAHALPENRIEFGRSNLRAE